MTISLPVTRVSADGSAGYALSFDGVSDYVIIGETNTVMGGRPGRIQCRSASG